MRNDPSQSPLLTLPRLWALVALAGILIAANLVQVNPSDFWWHVRAGQWIVEHRQIPTTDLFSFTRAGEAWAYQSWLMEVAMFLALRAGGLPLVIFLHALAITAAYAALLWVNRLAAGGNLRWAALATLAAAFASPNWNVRPQTLSILLFAVTLLLLERHVYRSEASRRPGLGNDPALWLLAPSVLALGQRPRRLHLWAPAGVPLCAGRSLGLVASQPALSRPASRRGLRQRPGNSRDPAGIGDGRLCPWVHA